MGSYDPEMLVSCRMDKIPQNQLCTRRSQDVSVRRFAVAAVCVSALMCVAVVVSTQLNMKTTLDKLSSVEEELTYIRRVLSILEIPEWLDENENEQIPSTVLDRQERSLKRRPMKSKPASHVPPYIHLFGNKNGRRHTEKDSIFFTWDKADTNPGIHGFELVGDSESGYHKIKVKHQGVYLIYAQVAVHGRDNVNKPYECSHETVCTRPDGTRIVLLSSLVTQYQLGGPYEKNKENQMLRALDTKLHMGVFMLHSGDVLSVQIPPSCENMEYSMTPQQSYFGLAQLNNHKEKTGRPVKPRRKEKP